MTVIGNDDELLQFINLCAKINYLCKNGTSEQINLIIDGDGSAGNLKFECILNNEGMDNVDMLKKWENRNADKFVESFNISTNRKHIHYIGE